MKEITRAQYEYYGCSSNKYLTRMGDRYYWTGPVGPMYWPQPLRK